MEECDCIQYLIRHGFVCLHGEKARGITKAKGITEETGIILEEGNTIVEVLVVQVIHEDQPGKTGLHSPRPLDIVVLKLLRVMGK